MYLRNLTIPVSKVPTADEAALKLGKPGSRGRSLDNNWNCSGPEMSKKIRVVNPDPHPYLQGSALIDA
jgi:hypothetical protein